MTNDKQNKPEKTDAQEEDPGFRNIAKIILLAVILIAAWVVLEWLAILLSCGSRRLHDIIFLVLMLE